MQSAGVVEHDGECAAEKSVVTVDADAAEQNFLFLADDVGDVVDDADVVVANDTKGDGVLTAALACPLGSDNAVAEALTQLWSVGAVLAMYLDAAATGDKAKDIVAIDRLAAFRHLEVDTLQVLVDDEDVGPSSSL